MPAPIICDYLSRETSRALYSAGTEFQIGRIDMVADTGTYLDTPFHRYADGIDLADLPLASVADLECLVAQLQASSQRASGALPFSATVVRGRTVPVHAD